MTGMPRALGVSLPSSLARPREKPECQTPVRKRLCVPADRDTEERKVPLGAEAARRLSLRSLRQLKGASHAPDEQTREQLRPTRVTFVRDRVWGAS